MPRRRRRRCNRWGLRCSLRCDLRCGEAEPPGALELDGAHILLYFAAGGVLDRFPELELVTVETGGSWLAWVMTQMDEIYEKHHMWAKPVLSMKPSEFVRRQCHVTFQNDPVAVATRAFTGVEPLLWGSDYPPVGGREGYRNSLQNVLEYPVFKTQDEKD